MTPTGEISLLCDGCYASVHISMTHSTDPDAGRVQVQCPACSAVVLDTSGTILAVTTC